jgi:hypothetical protein
VHVPRAQQHGEQGRGCDGCPESGAAGYRRRDQGGAEQARERIAGECGDRAARAARPSAVARVTGPVGVNADSQQTAAGEDGREGVAALVGNRHQAPGRAGDDHEQRGAEQASHEQPASRGHWSSGRNMIEHR